MDTFKEKFKEEAYEHVNELEKNLLELEKDPESIEFVEKIFRSMHTIKGGAAMFGFENINKFTHNLENIYDEIRNGKIDISKELLTLTLESVDHIKTLLEQDDDNNDLEISTKEKFLSVEISKILKQGNKKEESNNDNEDSNEPEVPDSEYSTYYILFQPHENILDNGTNPLYLIDILCDLGESLIFPHYNNIPQLQDLKPSSSYIYWEVVLATKEPVNEINDVFLFVEDLSNIEIQLVSKNNLLSSKTFLKKVNKLYNEDIDIGFDNIKLLSAKTRPSVASKVKRAIKDNTPAQRDGAISSIRVSSDKLDDLMNLVSELVTTQARLNLYAEQQSLPELMSISENVQKLSRQLRDIAFSIVLIPIENMLTRFHRLVRDLSNELKKDVKFIAEGTDTELDKTIIENLTDPLLHILRNSIDHGIELPEKREKAGKDRTGTIRLKAYYSGANVHIEISDDGAGINPEMIREKAISKGIISSDAQLSKKEIIDLIYLPGFSTAKTVTGVSGRGVGMDVVKKKIANIRGEIETESEYGKGTTLTIKLPLTLSIIDGLLVKIDSDFFVLPLSIVDKIYAIEHTKIKKSFNNVIVLDGKQVPFFYLRDEFEMPETKLKNEEVVVIQYENKEVGLIVDNVVGEYQAVLKPLGKLYKHQEFISGATILGDGTVALVMDTNKTVKKLSIKHNINQNVL